MSNHNHDKITDPTDPTVFGPGLWYSIHVTSLEIAEKDFINWIEIILNRIPCLTCKQHSLEYLSKNPIKDLQLGKILIRIPLFQIHLLFIRKEKQQ